MSSIKLKIYLHWVITDNGRWLTGKGCVITSDFVEKVCLRKKMGIYYSAYCIKIWWYQTNNLKGLTINCCNCSYHSAISVTTKCVYFNIISNIGYEFTDLYCFSKTFNCCDTTWNFYCIVGHVSTLIEIGFFSIRHF